MKSQQDIITGLMLLIGFILVDGSHTPVNAQVRGEAVSASSGLKRGQLIPTFSKKNIVSSKPLRLPVYKPPKGIGAPGGRVGGATRGDDPVLATLFALVPDHLGLTIKEQPSLYWYLSNQVDYKLVLTLNRHDHITPVLEVTLPDKAIRGIHAIHLKDHNVRLELDIEYQWFVELIVDRDHPARNVVAGGRIKRILPPETLLVKLREANPKEVTSVYSEAGLWYDAFDSISDWPEEPEHPIVREHFIKQVYDEEIDGIMSLAKEEESVSLMDIPMLPEIYQRQSLSHRLVEHRVEKQSIE